MKSRAVMVFAMILTLAMGGQVFASVQSSSLYGDSELIRVAYSPTGSVEWATDLGNVTTLATYSNQTVGGGSDAINIANITGAASLSDLFVAYFAIHNDAGSMANRVAWITFDNGLATPPVSGAKWFQNFQTAAANVALTYSGNAFTVQGAGSIASNLEGTAGYFLSMDNADAGNAGRFGGVTTSANNPGGEQNLSTLSTGGSVEQELYSFTGATLNGTKTGVPVMTVTTNSDGSTTINAVTVPEPTTYLLLCASLMILVGVRSLTGSRKMIQPGPHAG